eukprot:g388.t1
MSDVLDNVFDVIIVSTGLTESILAGALQRVGLNVLHIDESDDYGGPCFRGFTLNRFIDWAVDTTSSVDQSKDDKFSKVKIRFCQPIIPSVTQKNEISKVNSDENKSNTILGDKKTISTLANGSSASADGGAEVGNDSQKQVDSGANVTKVSNSAPVISKLIPECLEKSSRRFSIDLCPSLVYCRGLMVDVLTRSRLCDSIDFQIIDRCNVLTKKKKKTNSKTTSLFKFKEKGIIDGDNSTNSSSNLFEGENLSLLAVPCAKEELFKSTQLSMLEKRHIMRFLRFCFDKTTRDNEREELRKQAESENQKLAFSNSTNTLAEAVAWRNEQRGGLNKGRALPRPQNKKVVQGLELAFQKACSMTSSTEVTKDNKSNSFVDFLKNECRLSDRVCSLITYAIALQDKDQYEKKNDATHSSNTQNDDAKKLQSSTSILSVALGVALVQRYLSSLYIYGPTAFLLPMYGIQELPQVFSRYCAIWGGITMLNNPLTFARFIDYQSEKKEEEIGEKTKKDTTSSSITETETIIEVKDKKDRSLKARALVASQSDLERLFGKDRDEKTTSSLGKKTTRFREGTDNGQASTSLSSEQKLVRVVRVIITSISLNGNVPCEKEKVFLTIPPKSFGIKQKYSCHVLQFDWTTRCAPKGYYLIYLSTLEDICDRETHCHTDHETNHGNGNPWLECCVNHLFPKSKANLKSTTQNIHWHAEWSLPPTTALPKPSAEMFNSSSNDRLFSLHSNSIANSQRACNGSISRYLPNNRFIDGRSLKVSTEACVYEAKHLFESITKTLSSHVKRGISKDTGQAEFFPQKAAFTETDDDGHVQHEENELQNEEKKTSGEKEETTNSIESNVMMSTEALKNKDSDDAALQGEKFEKSDESKHATEESKHATEENKGESEVVVGNQERKDGTSLHETADLENSSAVSIGSSGWDDMLAMDMIDTALSEFTMDEDFQ